MNLLFVVPCYYPATRYGGPIKSIHDLARELVHQGERVTVFTTNANGLVRVEFYESFNDPEVNPDGIWNSGALTLRVVPVPEPATYGMMALGLLAVGAFVRRRKV